VSGEIRLREAGARDGKKDGAHKPDRIELAHADESPGETGRSVYVSGQTIVKVGIKTNNGVN
jgi:hypothetical protein